MEKPSFKRRKESRPAEITAAAIEEFSVNGYESTRIIDIARRANISKGLLYLYFNINNSPYLKKSFFPELTHHVCFVREEPRIPLALALKDAPMKSTASSSSALDFKEVPDCIRSPKRSSIPALLPSNIGLCSSDKVQLTLGSL